MSEDLATYIQGERERLMVRRTEVMENIEEFQNHLRAIEKEFAAIDAYEAAKTGKAATPKTEGNSRRPRNGSRREEIMSIISAAPAGLTRGEILERMKLKGDKSGEMSVSNALTAMTRREQLYREGGKYHAPADVLHEAAE